MQGLAYQGRVYVKNKEYSTCKYGLQVHPRLSHIHIEVEGEIKGRFFRITAFIGFQEGQLFSTLLRGIEFGKEDQKGITLKRGVSLEDFNEAPIINGFKIIKRDIELYGVPVKGADLLYKLNTESRIEVASEKVVMTCELGNFIKKELEFRTYYDGTLIKSNRYNEVVVAEFAIPDNFVGTAKLVEKTKVSYSFGFEEEFETVSEYRNIFPSVKGWAEVSDKDYPVKLYLEGNEKNTVLVPDEFIITNWDWDDGDE